MEPKIIYSILIILLAVSFFVGWQIGKITERKVLENEIYETQQQNEFLKSQLEELYPPISDEFYGISGRVIEIGDKSFIMEYSIRVSQFPLPGGAEVEIQNVKVIVTDQTKITINLLAIPTPGLELIPEEAEKVVSFSDIKVDNTIQVTSNENIKGKKEITATQIVIIPELT